MKSFFDDLSAHGDLTAVVTPHAEGVSYRKLAADADQMKEILCSRSLIFCFCQNNLESLVGYLGALRARAVPVLIDHNIHPELFQKLLLAYRPYYLWLPLNTSLAPAGCTCVHVYDNYMLMKTPFTEAIQLHRDLAQLMTTSGSTGSPKLVRQSYLNINHNANAIAQYLSITAGDRPITTLPMSYTYGLSIIASHLLKGCTLILNSYTLMEKAFWETLKTQSATTFGGVPYTYEMLKKLRFMKMELPSLKTITLAGGKLRANLVEEFASICELKKINFVVMYGQTEATARMSYLPSKYARSKPDSIGVAIPEGAFWLEDDRGQKITSHDEVGELVYKGANVSMGYALSYSDLCKTDHNQGVLRTGDMAKRDVDGFYYIVGRRARFLKLFGKRVNMDEVEQLLLSEGYECACAGEDELMKIFVTGNANPEIVKKFIVERTGIAATAFSVTQLDTIPRNVAGKILYANLE